MFSLDSSARKLFHGLHWRLVESKQGLLKFSGGEVGEFDYHCVMILETFLALK